MKMLLIRTVVTIAVSIIALIGYGTWYTVISHKSATVAELQSTISVKTETASRIASARATISEIAGDENIVQNYFVSENGVVAFISDLEAHGKTLGAAVNVLSVSTKTSHSRPMLLLSLSIKGTFNSVMRTIGIIEYAPYDLLLSDLSVGQDDENEWHADLKILVGSVKTNTP